MAQWLPIREAVNVAADIAENELGERRVYSREAVWRLIGIGALEAVKNPVYLVTEVDAEALAAIMVANRYLGGRPAKRKAKDTP